MKLWDVASGNTPMAQDIMALLSRVVVDEYESSRQVADFETAVRGWYATDAMRVVGVNSGTAAIFLSLIALGIGPGDEVITVCNSDMANTATISHAGASAVLCDVEPGTHNLDPSRLPGLLTSRTKAIVPVHMYGCPADMDPIMQFARKHGLYVIEDATLAMGATYKGAKAGAIGDAGCLSFGPHKVLCGISSAGAILTRNPEIEKHLRLLTGYGQDLDQMALPKEERLRRPFRMVEEGYNLRMNSLEAAILNVKIRHFEDTQGARRRIAGVYDGILRDANVVLPDVPPDRTHSWRNYVVLVPHRDAVKEELFARGIPTFMLFVPSAHLHPVYAQRFGGKRFPVAEALARHLLCLPLYPGMPIDDATGVAHNLKDVCGKYPLSPDDQEFSFRGTYKEK